MASRQQTVLYLMFIALAMTLSTMTSLRFDSVPLGPAELILIGCMITHVPLGHGIHVHDKSNRFVFALGGLFLLTLPGLFVTLTFEGSVPWVMYSLISSVWVVVLFGYLHFGFDQGRDELTWLIRLFVLLSSVYFAVVLVLAVVEPQTVYLGENVFDRIEQVQATEGSSDFNKDVLRLQGFTTWPNQLALHALIALFFTLALWRRNGTVVSLVCLGLATTVGILTRSDAFLFSLVALLCMWVTAGILIRRSVVLMLLVLVPAATFSLLMIKPVVNEIQAISETGDQDKVRFRLWENGIAAGLERPLTGLGPGIWSGPDAPRELEEAHNSAIDYFSNAGVPGTLLLFVAGLSLLWRALRSDNPAMFAGTVSILLYSMFHNVLRQPIFWLSLYYIAQSVWPGARSVVTRRRRVRRSSRGRGLPV